MSRMSCITKSVVCPRVNYPLCEDGSLLTHFTVFDYILLWCGHTISIRQLVGQFLRPRNMDELDVGVHAFFSVCRKHRLSTLTGSGLHWLLYSGQRRCEVMLKVPSHTFIAVRGITLFSRTTCWRGHYVNIGKILAVWRGFSIITHSTILFNVLL